MDTAWNNFIGDLKVGRNNLGEEMPVSVYRLLEFTMYEAIKKRFDETTAITLFQEAGQMAGVRFTQSLLDVTLKFDDFVIQLQELMLQLKMGILRIEEADFKANHFVLTVSEDLDCSGLPISGETVCHYDEGFLKGVLQTYLSTPFDVVEIDCWAKGGRVCRFRAEALEADEE